MRHPLPVFPILGLYRLSRAVPLATANSDKLFIKHGTRGRIWGNTGFINYYQVPGTEEHDSKMWLLKTISHTATMRGYEAF